MVDTDARGYNQQVVGSRPASGAGFAQLDVSVPEVFTQFGFYLFNSGLKKLTFHVNFHPRHLNGVSNSRVVASQTDNPRTVTPSQTDCNAPGQEFHSICIWLFINEHYVHT